LERTKTEEAQLVQQGKASETAEATQSPQEYISRLLFGLITHAGDATARLHTLSEQYPHNSTGTSGIENQLSGLCACFKRLSKHHEDARNDLEFDKMEAVVQEICHSAQYTLDDIMAVFDTGSDATRWESWTQLTRRMDHLEKAGLSERLKWYLNSMLDLLHHLDGNTRSVRLGQWMGADEKIAALLERQERFRKTSQPATSSTIQLPAPTGFPNAQLPAAPLEATDTNTRSRRPYDDFPTDQLQAAPLEAFDTNTKYRRPFDGFPTDDRFDYQDDHPEGS
jgi:hypothetical protein